MLKLEIKMRQQYNATVINIIVKSFPEINKHLHSFDYLVIVEVNVSNHDVLCLVLNGCLATAGFYYTKTRFQTVDSLGLNPANC